MVPDIDSLNTKLVKLRTNQNILVQQKLNLFVNKPFGLLLYYIYSY